MKKVTRTCLVNSFVPKEGVLIGRGYKMAANNDVLVELPDAEAVIWGTTCSLNG